VLERIVRGLVRDQIAECVVGLGRDRLLERGRRLAGLHRLVDLPQR
jgi:hypothetical protein